MEEFNKKLTSESPTVVLQVISKLVQSISNKIEINDSIEFKTLKEQCLNLDKSISVVAAEGLLGLAEKKSYFARSVISDLVTFITTTKSTADVAYLINKLLHIDLKNELSDHDNYKYFNLRLPQHPFIVMLNENGNCWNAIIREMVLSYKSADESILAHYDELYKPVFLYYLCNPNEDNFITFRQKMWTLILQKQTCCENEKFLYSFLSWMQLENKDMILMNSELLTELSDFNKLKKIIDSDILFLWQITSLYHIILYNLDPRPMLYATAHWVPYTNNKVVLNIALVILSKCILKCPSPFLAQLINLSKEVLLKSSCDVITKNIFKYALLQWIANCSSLIPNTMTAVKKLFAFLNNETFCSNPKGYLKFYKNNGQIINTNSEVYCIFQVYILIESWKSDLDLLSFLKRIEEAPTFFIIRMIDFLIGLFLTNFAELEISLRILDLILKCVEYKTSQVSNVVTAFLYKLTSTTDSVLYFCLLKSMPKVAVTKHNFQKVVNTILALSNGQNTSIIFSMMLMLDLWKIDNKCFPYLEKLFIVSCSVPGKHKWEFYETRAHVLKELCISRPEKYGKEIVAHLSKILNECNHPHGANASALAIEGITLLCKSEIIDAVTTWATLAPMFQNENRIPVIKGVCGLISEIPGLSYSDSFPNLSEEVVKKLWDYIILNPDDEVWKAALKALTKFTVEQIVQQMPQEYFDEDTLNLMRKNAHFIPGQCWILFLKNCTKSKLSIAGDFLIQLISLEVTRWLKYVYQVKGTREPVDYSYLPANSVVRGISTYIKSEVMKWKHSPYKEVYLECLRVFSQEYSKPLPPLDWCFLQELFHERETKRFCINIACHQVILSGTARRLVVNYIETIVKDPSSDEDIILIYFNLQHLANSIQPFILKPFFESTFKKCVSMFKLKKEELLVEILKHVNRTLKSDGIQEANKIVMAEIIKDIFDNEDISSKLFQLLLQTVILFPMNLISELFSPKPNEEMTANSFKKNIIVHCTLIEANKNASLNLLNELIIRGASFPDLTQFTFVNLTRVFVKHKDNTESVLWILELIGQIQAAIAEKTDEKEIPFLCIIFILAVVVFSGHYIFLRNFENSKDLYNLFPRALATLLDVNHWSICTSQALEWCHHMVTEKKFHVDFEDMFIQCLQALRHEPEFQKNMKWIKYLNVACDI